MKISIGMKLREGPWGGGNQFGLALKKAFESRGIEVVHHLKDPDIDFILLCEPRRKLKISAYSDREIFGYLARTNSRAIVIHRINECDERKGTRDVNGRLLTANCCADHTVFVSEWLRQLFISHGFQGRRSSVILNGSDASIFNSAGYREWNGQGPLRLVTHHWSGHWMKGFDIYQRLDQMMGEDRYGQRYSFTYIGGKPPDFQFKNSRYIEPTSGVALANLLKEHHVYVTASRNEPGGNHQNEGASCGLPVLYLRSGCMPEYVNDFGLGYDEADFEDRLEEMRGRYAEIRTRLPAFDRTSDRMAENYTNLIEELAETREAILKDRAIWGRLKWRWRLWRQG